MLTHFTLECLRTISREVTLLDYCIAIVRGLDRLKNNSVKKNKIVLLKCVRK